MGDVPGSEYSRGEECRSAVNGPGGFRCEVSAFGYRAEDRVKYNNISQLISRSTWCDESGIVRVLEVEDADRGKQPPLFYHGVQ